MRLRLAGMVAIALVAFILPASATAATRYVAEAGADSGDCLVEASPCSTIQYAADQATSGDTVEIAAGTYEESVSVTDKALAFVGAGSGTLEDDSGATIVDAPSGIAAFDLRRGGELRSLRALGGAGTGPFPGGPGSPAILLKSQPGVESEATVDSVVAIGGSSFSSSGNGLWIPFDAGDVTATVEASTLVGASSIGGSSGTRVEGELSSLSVRDSTLIGVSGVPGSSPPALAVNAGASVDAEMSSLEGGAGASARGASLELRRSTVVAEQVGVEAMQVPAGPATTVTVFDSLIEVELEESAPPTFSARGVVAQATEPGEPAALRAKGTTIVGAGNGEGAAALALRDDGAAPATVELHNSIAFHTGETSSDLWALGGTIDARHVSFTSSEVNNQGTSQGTISETNQISGDPGFADPESGDYSLQSTSALIDAGDASIVMPGQLDLAGASRSLDGNDDCVIAPDIGAFELTGHEASCPQPGDSGKGGSTASPPTGSAPAPPDAPPVVSAFAKRGNRFTFTLSEPSKVTITVKQRKRDRGALEELTSTCGEHMDGKCPTFRRSATLRARKGDGSQAIRFADRLRGKPLEPGSYIARIVAVDSSGLRSTGRRTHFHVAD